MTRSRDVANIDTILTTKGDIYAASAAYTPTRLGVGNNGETLVADSSASQGLRWSGANQQNPIINSGFDIWQRGTSFAGTSANTNTFGPDRWVIFRTGFTFSRQTTSDTTNLPNIQYCLRVQRNSGVTATDSGIVANQFETVNSIPFAGKTVTMSFYARAGANFSGASSTLRIQLNAGTGTDQRVLDGYTNGTNPIDSNITLTTTWQRFSLTGNIPSTTTEISTTFIHFPTGTAGANDYFEVTGVQLDIGSTALPYRRSASTLAGELAAAMRYYQKSYEQGTAPATNNSTSYQLVIAGTVTNGSYYAFVPFRVPMRGSPTVNVYSYANSTLNTSSGLTTGTDQATNSATATGARYQGFDVYNNSGGSITGAGGGHIFHWVASAEL